MKNDLTLRDIYNAIGDFREEMRTLYVTKTEFEPVRNISYGIIGAIGFAVIGALLSLVIKSVNAGV